MSHASADKHQPTGRLSIGLSAALRAETRGAHAAAEKRFVRAAKARPGSGPRLLMGLNFGLVSWLARAAQELPPGRLREEIAVFTGAVLDAHAAPAAGAPEGPGAALADPDLRSPAEIAGAAYAVCGSTLGASVLADAWRDETDARWLRFCAASRALERRWPLLAAALDDWGDAHDDAARRAAASGADRAFIHAGALVGVLAHGR